MGRAVWAKAIAMGAASESGLQCSQDIGANYGFRADYDVCEAAGGNRDLPLSKHR